MIKEEILLGGICETCSVCLFNYDYDDDGQATCNCSCVGRIVKVYINSSIFIGIVFERVAGSRYKVLIGNDFALCQISFPKSHIFFFRQWT